MESLKGKSLRVICKCVCPKIASSLYWESNSYSDDDSEDEEPSLTLGNGKVAVVREQLEKLGIDGGCLRELLWKEFNRRGDEKRPDVSMFLNCILNENITFLQLEADHFQTETSTFKKIKSNPTKVVEVIVKQCPSIKSLLLVVPRSYFVKEEKMMCLSPFLSLTQLTKLDLIWPSSLTSCRSFFTDIGTSCPNLQQLKMGDLKHPLKTDLQHQIALVIGKNVELLSSQFWEKEEGPDCDLHRFQFAEEHLTPICKSLKHLEICDKVNKLVPSISIQALAFLLRHIPGLEKLELLSSYGLDRGWTGSRTGRAIELLHELKSSKDGQQKKQQTTFKDICLTWMMDSPPPSKYFILKSLYISTIKSMFFTILFLEELNLTDLSAPTGNVDVRNSKMLKAISSMCPRLNAIRFDQGDHKTPGYEEMSIEQFSPFLTNNFTQVLLY